MNESEKMQKALEGYCTHCWAAPDAAWHNHTNECPEYLRMVETVTISGSANKLSPEWTIEEEVELEILFGIEDEE